MTTFSAQCSQLNRKHFNNKNMIRVKVEQSQTCYQDGSRFSYMQKQNETNENQQKPVQKPITKTRLFKYTENFTSKNRNFSGKKTGKKTLIFFIFLLKT